MGTCLSKDVVKKDEDSGCEDVGSKDAGSKDAGSKDVGSKDVDSKDAGSDKSGFIAVDIPYNEVEGWDQDHWFKIPLDNDILFAHLDLKFKERIVPGNIYTTRMPRNLKTEPQEAVDFQKKVEERKLNAVMILTEPEEYEKYAGTDLEEFYHNLGIKTYSRPIKDFDVPSVPEMITDINDVTLLIGQGENVLIHCAGGSGRTGMVVACVIRNFGIPHPIQWARQFKSTYVETPEQEKFVEEIPLTISKELSESNERLAKAIVADQWKSQVEEKNSSDSGPRIPEALLEQYLVQFDLFDKNDDGFITKVELKSVLKGLSKKVTDEDVDKMIANNDTNDDDKISKSEFLKMMSIKV